MDEYNNIEPGMRFLPGVDLALWLRIVVLVLMAAVVAGLAVAAS